MPSDNAAQLAIIGAMARINREILLGFVFPLIVSLR